MSALDRQSKRRTSPCCRGCSSPAQRQMGVRMCLGLERANRLMSSPLIRVDWYTYYNIIIWIYYYFQLFVSTFRAIPWLEQSWSSECSIAWRVRCIFRRLAQPWDSCVIRNPWGAQSQWGQLTHSPLVPSVYGMALCCWSLQGPFARCFVTHPLMGSSICATIGTCFPHCPFP